MTMQWTRRVEAALAEAHMAAIAAAHANLESAHLAAVMAGTQDSTLSQAVNNTQADLEKLRQA